MKRLLLIILSSSACLAAIMLSHYYYWPLHEWTRPLIAFPIIYAGISFRRAGSSSAAFISLIAQTPIIFIYTSGKLEDGIKYFVAQIVTMAVSIYVGHIIRKSKDNSKQLNRMHEMVRNIQRAADPDSLFAMLEKRFCELGKTREVETILLDEQGNLRHRARPDDAPLPREHFFYNVFETGAFIVCKDVRTDPRFEYIGNPEQAGLVTQFAAFPIEYGGRRRGVISLANSKDDKFGEETISFLNTVRQAIENALDVIEKRQRRIQHELQRRKIRDIFSSYVSRSVAEEILKDPDSLELGGKNLSVTVMFTEVTNFNELQKNIVPAELLSMLNEYFGLATDIIFELDGTLDKFIGNNIMAFWGAPLPVADSEMRAIHCAQRLQRAMTALNREWAERGKHPFDVSIGINSGEVVAGNIGSIRRMEYTIIGDTVNTASRIKALSKSRGIPILIGESTFLKIKEKFETIQKFDAHVKGKTEIITVYQLSV